MSKNKYLTYLKTLGVFFAFGLLSCFKPPQENIYVSPAEYPLLVEQSWYLNKECQAPCWRGLKISDSSKEDALEIAKGLNFIDFSKNRQIAPEVYMFPCASNPETNCLSMQFTNDELRLIRIYPNFKVTFEQVISEIGEPDSYIIYRAYTERKGCALKLLWIDMGLELTYKEEPINFGDDLCDLVYDHSNKIPLGLYVMQASLLPKDEMGQTVESAQVKETGYNYVLWSGFDK